MNEEIEKNKWGYHWPVMIAVIIASVLNWWIGHLIFTTVTICGLEWLDIVGTYLWALWWIFAFVVWGYWPFNKISDWWTKGITMIIVSWILGVFCWWLASFIVNLQVYGFPILAGLFFWIVVTDFSFHLWSKQPAYRKATLDLLLWHALVGITIIILPYPGLMPAWWFVPTQMILGSGIMAYWGKNMSEGEAGITFWLLNIIMVFFAVATASALGFFKFSLTNPYTTLISGYSLEYLVWFGAGCSFNWSVYTIFEGWPWRKMKPTAGAIISFIIIALISVVATAISIFITKAIWPPTGPKDVYYLLQAFALAYAGVEWGFTIPLAFSSKRTGFPPSWKWKE